MSKEEVPEQQQGPDVNIQIYEDNRPSGNCIRNHCSKPDSTVRLTTSAIILDGTVLLHQMQVLSTTAMNDLVEY
jgi:hypothetical protein